MAGYWLTKGSVRTQQPQTAVGSNPAFPSIRCLVNAAAGPINEIGNKQSEVSAANRAGWTKTPKGFTFYKGVSAPVLSWALGAFSAIKNGSAYSIAGILIPGSYITSLAVSDSVGSFSALRFYVTAGNVLSLTLKTDDGVDMSITGPTLVDSSINHMVGVWRPGIGIDLFVNGVQYTRATTARTTTYVPPGVFEMVAGNAGGLGVGQMAGAVLSEALSIESARQLSSNVWQLWKPQQRRIWVPVSAGAGVPLSWYKA